jgi:hypothetical protein
VQDFLLGKASRLQNLKPQQMKQAEIANLMGAYFLNFLLSIDRAIFMSISVRSSRNSEQLPLDILCNRTRLEVKMAAIASRWFGFE